MMHEMNRDINNNNNKVPIIWIGSSPESFDTKWDIFLGDRSKRHEEVTIGNGEEQVNITIKKEDILNTHIILHKWISEPLHINELDYENNTQRTYGLYQRIKIATSILLLNNQQFMLGAQRYQIHLVNDVYYLYNYTTAQNDIINTQSFFIGRDPTDNYQPQDGGISTHHAKLEFDNKRNLWTIYDHGRLGKGSKNGIWLRITYADITQFDFTSSFSIGKDTYIHLRAADFNPQ